MSDDLSGKKEKTLMERLFGAKDAETKQAETEEEILSLVEEGKEKGLIEDDTKNIIENVFDFDDTVAYEIMTHRRDMTSLEDTDSLKEVVDTAIASGHSRIPVYHEDIDNIIGVLYVKDLLQYVGVPAPADFKLRALLRPALFVPRTKDCRSLFAFMQKHRTQCAIVVDEYGGTEGIITLEDLIEDILGNIRDEYDDEEDEIRKISDDRFTVRLSKGDDVTDFFEFDLSGQPDLAQTVVVTCCMMGIPFHLTGLSTLRIKETDRLSALQTELGKLGFAIEVRGDSELLWDGNRKAIDEEQLETVAIDTYKDHRMAMAFAPCALRLPFLNMNNPEVVSKSYPTYWETLERAGFMLNR